MIYQQNSNVMQQDLFYQLGEKSTDGYFVYDIIDCKFLYFNTALASIWGLKPEDISKSPTVLFDRVHPDDQVLVGYCFQEISAESIFRKYEFRLMLENEDVKYLKMSISQISGVQHTTLCGIVEDITVDRQNKILIEMINNRKNIALEVLSHDLKEPFGMMKLAASSMVNGIEDKDETYLSEGLSFIIEMCERNMKMVRSLINKEFLKSSEVEIKKERTDLVWEFRDLIRFYRRSRLKEKKNFSFNCKADRIYIRMDSMKFLQVLNNLISNAIKFTADQGEITLTAQEMEETVLISVADNGCGIPVELRSTLFDRGEQGLKRGLSGEESHGLGMGIIKAIVDLHGGKIWFDTEINKGTTFYIMLPK
ncbi:PAS domain-containing sensor histidine kinase [Pedobacter sp. MR22-3]|uniref:PAS domain-containing sensor histidine kinase n=1 Tax=Pedobacter sp. MR22-3 TaxID=2994552 RepID=UPI0022472A74|nr:PAS domain-containing sensor histidine kinase [Pedobacter sp. MR22-3]MCX2586286.1 PAS domain-containing sensor histidine kinase [Pedobacter sp. MR22-3]